MMGVEGSGLRNIGCVTNQRPETSTPIIYGLALATPARVVEYLARALTRYHKRIGTRWRAHEATTQAVLTVAWLEGGHTYRKLGEGNGVNIPTERVAAQYTRKQHWYSGKHKRHGGAVQTVAAPDGELLWVSGVLPGRTVDITAARRFGIAEKVLAFLGLLADLGYIGLHPQVITGYKRKRGEKTLPEAKKAANRVQASLRCIGERANAQLKCWRVLTCDFRGRPRQLTTIVKAVQALQYLIRDPFGTAGIGTAS